MQSVSVIGLGAMGARLAECLLGAGYEVTVWNRTAARAAPLVDAGARQAGSVAEAVGASNVTLTCVRSHDDTRALLGTAADEMAGKTILELSTGDAAEAQALMDWIGAQGSAALIGMIAVFPKDIGKAESAILAVGDAGVWESCADILTALAGKSALVGERPAALAAIYAALVLPRQGFMFGMIYGAMICEKAGVSMDDYVAQLPLTLAVTRDYCDLFAATVPRQDFGNPPASLGVYHAAFRDVLKTCDTLGAPTELPQLLHDLLERGVEAGLQDKQVTILTRLLQT